MESCIVSDLEVAGLDSGWYCEMPDIFTQREMPVNRSNIPRQEDLHKWPHLKRVLACDRCRCGASNRHERAQSLGTT